MLSGLTFPHSGFSRLLHSPSRLLNCFSLEQGPPLGQPEARMVFLVEKAVSPKPAWSGVRENRSDRSWGETLTLCDVSHFSFDDKQIEIVNDRVSCVVKSRDKWVNQ